ncbi:histidine phosphatase family protein [Alicyclobacillus fastidiosus]|uniref:Histidine phosphatase family protein n=1 Tax=Alicyclobacillus fastidiosus TaxID=392011 RepID=A0ABV5AHI8_9BACL|nr:histidine phosphatase family protein [Alicyclobacillus fastidiosus]WEH11703.1 histidine phosphatase family protein [Alicyclobacillus fastidiosus]
MEIWLIRHGETDWNVSGRVQGWTDIPLNAVGREQARRLADYLEGVPFAHIYSSDLSRALDTAKAVAAKTGTPITTTKLLREQHFGQAEGLQRADKERRFPNGAPGAETSQDVERRIGTFLTDLTNSNHSGRFIVATHGGVIKGALRWVGMKNVPITNTSITCLKFERGVFHVKAVNATPHLTSPTDSSTAGISQHG